jgi:hypothetical protein
MVKRKDWPTPTRMEIAMRSGWPILMPTHWPKG